MASAKGYHSYRGRGSKVKVILAILLCLVILAAAAVIYLLEHSVYDENGVRHLEIPWLPEEEPASTAEGAPPEEPTLDLVIQEPPKPEPLRLFSLPGEAVTQELWAARSGAAGLDSAVSYGGVAVTLKDGEGRIYYDSSAALSNTTVKKDTGETLALITAGSGHTVARLACLADAPVARVHVTDMGLKNTGGYIFYDGNNRTWLDPAKEDTAAYLSALAAEAADLGFDEVLLTDVTYPTAGKLDKIAYTGEEDLSRNVTALVRAVREALGEREILLSIELPEAVAAGTPDGTAGLDLKALAPLVDRIYAITTPERAETLSQHVKDANETTEFFPEFTLAAEAANVERCLVLPQAE